MDFKRALDTQRTKLLRLLTGWIVVLRVLSLGPVAWPVPRWVRAHFETLIIRAELAAHNLVRVSVCLQASNGWRGAIKPPRSVREEADVPSARDLLRRIEALRDLLENLSRHARRLLTVRVIAGAAFDYAAPPRCAVTQTRPLFTRTDWIVPGIERPPDKGCRFRLIGYNSPRVAGGRRWSLFNAGLSEVRVPYPA